MCCKVCGGFPLTAFVEAKAHLTAHVMVSCSPNGVAPKVTTQARLRHHRLPQIRKEGASLRAAVSTLTLGQRAATGNFTSSVTTHSLRKLSGHNIVTDLHYAGHPLPYKR
jgi:hypothetical protein